MSFAPATGQSYGVVLALFTAGSHFGVRVERAPDNGAGAPNLAAVEDLGLAPPNAHYWVDRLPPDGALRFYRLRQWREGYSPSDATCWKAARPALLPEAIVDPQPVPPEFREELGEASGMGTLRLGINDPQCRVVQVARQIQVHGQPPAAFEVEPAVLPVHEFSVPLGEKHFNTVTYRVTYYDAQGQLRERVRTVGFDIDSVPTGVEMDVTVPRDGVPVVRLRGDSDTRSWRVAGEAGTGEYPTDAEVEAAPAQAGREVEVRLAGLLVAPGQEVRVAAFPYAGDHGTGTRGLRLERRTSGPQTPSASVDLVVLASGAARLRVSGIASIGSVSWLYSTTGQVQSGTRTVRDLAAGASLDERLGVLQPGQTGFVTVWLHSGPGRQGVEAGPVLRSRTYALTEYPRVEGVTWVNGTLGLDYRGLFFRVADPRNLGGTLRVWVNRAGPETPHLGSDGMVAVPEGSVTVAATPFQARPDTVFTLMDGSTALLLRDIPQNAKDGKRVYVEFVNTDGVSSGHVALSMPSRVGVITFDGDIEVNAIRTQHIAADQIVANHLRVDRLDEIADDVGIIVSGRLQNASGSAFLDLNATGTAPFLRHDSLSLNADGSASFEGTVALRTDTNWSYISFQNASGQEYGHLGPTYYTNLNGDPMGSGLDIAFSGRRVLEIYDWNDGSHGQEAVWSVNSFMVLLEDAPNNQGHLVWERGTGSVRSTWYWKPYINQGTSYPGAMLLCWGDIYNTCFIFGKDGRAYADLGWSTFSPEPPRSPAEMSAGEWIAWAAEDARKPVKPYAGLPAPDHPEIRRLAGVRGRKEEVVVEEEVRSYGKDISKIAIGTARWADLVHQALAGARDFDDFKRRLGVTRG